MDGIYAQLKLGRCSLSWETMKGLCVRMVPELYSTVGKVSKHALRRRLTLFLPKRHAHRCGIGDIDLMSSSTLCIEHIVNGITSQPVSYPRSFLISVF